jgi:hypothetical protein
MMRSGDSASIGARSVNARVRGSTSAGVGLIAVMQMMNVMCPDQRDVEQRHRTELRVSHHDVVIRCELHCRLPVTHGTVQGPQRTSDTDVHRASAHLEPLSVRSCDEPVGLRGVHSHEQAALAARAHGHVPVDEECETTEHAPLGEPAFLGDKLAYAIGKIIVECHVQRVLVTTDPMPQRPAPGDSTVARLPTRYPPCLVRTFRGEGGRREH